LLSSAARHHSAMSLKRMTCSSSLAVSFRPCCSRRRSAASSQLGSAGLISRKYGQCCDHRAQLNPRRCLEQDTLQTTLLSKLIGMTIAVGQQSVRRRDDTVRRTQTLSQGIEQIDIEDADRLVGLDQCQWSAGHLRDHRPVAR